MATAEEVQERIDRLDEAIAEGAVTVRFRDRSVTYRSLDAMRTIRRELQKQLSALNGKRPRRGPTLITSRKGL